MLVMLQFRKPQPWWGRRWMHFHNWETMPKRQRANPINKLAQTNINILPFGESLNKQMSLCIMHWGSIRPALTHKKGHWNSRGGEYLHPNPLGPGACLFGKRDLSTFPVLQRAFRVHLPEQKKSYIQENRNEWEWIISPAGIFSGNQ